MKRRAPDVPTCKGLRKWLALNLGGSPRAAGFGALTGTDNRALDAAAHILELRAVSGDEGGYPGLLEAFRVVVLRMQPSTRYFAYHAIAFLGEWHHRAEVWAAAGLPALERVPRCHGDRDAWTYEEWTRMRDEEERREERRRQR